MSVAGGSWKFGNWLASAGFFGPGSSRLVRLFPLILPSGGESGLPNVPADAAADTPSAAAEAAAPSRISRRDKLVMDVSPIYGLGYDQSRDSSFPIDFAGLAPSYDCNPRGCLEVMIGALRVGTPSYKSVPVRISRSPGAADRVAPAADQSERLLTVKGQFTAVVPTNTSASHPVITIAAIRINTR